MITRDRDRIGGELDQKGVKAMPRVSLRPRAPYPTLLHVSSQIIPHEAVGRYYNPRALATNQGIIRESHPTMTYPECSAHYKGGIKNSMRTCLGGT